jgi:hypothetical protein
MRDLGLVSRVKSAVALALLLATTVAAQPSTRRATNIAALISHPGFYHLRPVVVVGTVALRDSGERRVGDQDGSLRVVFKGTSPEGPAEIRGEFWDVGRMNADDPRLAGYDLRATFQIDPDAAWPRPGQVLALVAGSIEPAPPALTPSIRSIVLHPARFLEQKVTVTGQFAGRNLLGDLPDAPAQSRYDFVLRSADAAIWVTNMRPRGRDFELSLDARIDTGRWLQVSGTVQQGRGLQWLNAEAGTLTLTKPPAEMPEVEPIRVPAAPPPEVVFSAPLDGETDVPSSTNLRVQFSRDIDPATFKSRVRVTYAPAGPGAEPEAVPFTTSYLPGNRVLEIRFAPPLQPFRVVRVELGEGIMGTDKQPLKPEVISFTTGT